MSVQTIHLVAGDTAPALRATLANADGPQDLTAAAVVMRLKPSDGSAVLALPVDIESPATAGVVSHVWDPTETDEALSYKVEFVVTFADLTVETFPVLVGDVPTIAIRARKT